MTWRYTTIDCVRVWRFYARVGLPEIARTAIACARVAAVLGPLVVLPGAVPGPWIEVPRVAFVTPAVAMGFPGDAWGAVVPARGVGVGVREAVEVPEVASWALLGVGVVLVGLTKWGRV